MSGLHEPCYGCEMIFDTKTLKWCSVCQSVKYCSKECQKLHWPTHKLRCQPVSNTQSTKQELSRAIRSAINPFADFVSAYAYYYKYLVPPTKRANYVYVHFIKGDDGYLAALTTNNGKLALNLPEMLDVVFGYANQGEALMMNTTYSEWEAKKLLPMITELQPGPTIYVTLSYEEGSSVSILDQTIPSEWKKVERLVNIIKTTKFPKL